MCSPDAYVSNRFVPYLIACDARAHPVFGLYTLGMKKIKINWLKVPQRRDYPAARACLNLLLEPRVSQKLVKQLKRKKVQRYAAKDIFRAAAAAV
jgi:hypothetical protein